MKVINVEFKKEPEQLDLFPPLAQWEINTLQLINDCEKLILAIKKEKLGIIVLRDWIKNELEIFSMPDDVILIEEMRRKINMEKDLKEINKWLFGIDSFIYESELDVLETKLGLTR